MAQVVEIPQGGRQEPMHLTQSYIAGDDLATGSQVISSHDIDLICPWYFGPNTKKVESSKCITHHQVMSSICSRLSPSKFQISSSVGYLDFEKWSFF